MVRSYPPYWATKAILSARYKWKPLFQKQHYNVKSLMCHKFRHTSSSAETHSHHKLYSKFFGAFRLSMPSEMGPLVYNAQQLPNRYKQMTKNTGFRRLDQKTRDYFPDVAISIGLNKVSRDPPFTEALAWSLNRVFVNFLLQLQNRTTASLR
jgi:hypothetical protein